VDEKTFFERLNRNPRPVILDFWAPWCLPCRSIEPVIEHLGDEYAGRVEVWKVNADEQPGVLRKLNIYGIPTLVAYHAGQEITRRTGAASASVLSSLFEAALVGEKPARQGLTPSDRIIRLVAGLFILALAGLGHFSGWYLALAGLSGVILFSAVYDRCPIWNMVAPKIGNLFHRSNPQ
jgi:thioredoxin